MEEDKTMKKSVNEKEKVSELRCSAYELQRRHWMKQLQPHKVRTNSAKARETKKDKEDL